jgi:hypothetical protein
MQVIRNAGRRQNYITQIPRTVNRIILLRLGAAIDTEVNDLQTADKLQHEGRYFLFL